jgi:Fe-S cluster assembly protein SufD
MGAGTQAGPHVESSSTTVEDLHDSAAAGTPGLAAPGTDQHGFVAHGHGARAGVEGATDGVPTQSRAERRASFDVADFEVPTGREEEWRFTPLDRLRDLHGGAAPSGPAPDVEVEVPAGFAAETVERGDERLGRTGTPEDRIAAQTWVSAEAATVVTLEKSVVAEQPAVVRVTGRGGTHYLQIVLRAATQSAGVVVLDHRGSGALGANVEIDVEDAAQLTVVSVQDWADDAVHATAHTARLGRDAKLKHVVVTLGGDLVRLASSTRFTAPGSHVEALGLYFADAGQHQEHRLFIDHAVPNCVSRVTYKGALQGDGAHTVWVGDVLIRAQAEGTDTYELNRNLVLTEGARADSVPNLEIETGEIVGAGHASATGRFDDEQLFYLQARGIPELEARRLVVRGFFAELVQRIGVPAVEERLMASIEAELAASVGEGLDEVTSGFDLGVDLEAEDEVTA